MANRRDFLKKWVAVLSAVGVLPKWAGAGPKRLEAGNALTLPTVPAALPGERRLLKKTCRPPNYETPLIYFNELFTPNDAFFVRYHLSTLPNPDADTWRLTIGGDALSKPLTLTLADLQRNFRQTEIAAVNQCSGNRRRLVEPRVPGVQWGYGAMGNARWRGVRLQDVLAQCGLAENAVAESPIEVVANGADKAPDPHTPDFIKSIPLAKALDENTLIAFAMNGEPLPHWHGYPARLVVPGWTATYWVKHLTSLKVVGKPFDGFWMKTSYRIPIKTFPNSASFKSQEADGTMPITDIRVNSLVTNLESGQTLPKDAEIDLHGIAWDSGNGIERVEISTDNAQNWHIALLQNDHGRFSWRQWRFRFRPASKGAVTILVKATSCTGETQPFDYVQNPAGYHHNAIQKLVLTIV
jgi:DMSO/TMAO reductase YedYZ molybdopterin-dependent catalytic subunit